jgi:hypothetical protein
MSGEASSSRAGDGKKQARIVSTAPDGSWLKVRGLAVTDSDWQEETDAEGIVKVGVKLMTELGGRARKVEKLEGELAVYREAMTALANSLGVEVPAFLEVDTGSLGEAGSAEELRTWLQGVLPGQATKEKKSASRGRGRGTSGKPRKGGRDKKSVSDRMDEDD